MAKNKRQPYAVSEKAGHQTSAESWGTGERNLQFINRHNREPTLTFWKVALLPVSHVFQEEVHTVLVKPRLEICAVRVACLHLPRSGESGIKRSIWDKSAQKKSARGR